MTAQELQKPVSYHEFASLVQDVNDMKSLMSMMVDALNRIAVIDERQQTSIGMMQKLDERLGRTEDRQREADIARAVGQAASSRLDAIEKVIAELHVERERDKARFQTVIWMVRGLWAMVTFLGIGGIIGLARWIGA